MKLSKLTTEIKHCKTIFSKARGLIFTLNKNRSLVFHFSRPTHSPLHMFGVFYPIDVLFLNKEKRIIEMKRDFRPFTFYNPKNKANYIVELPNGIIDKNKLKLNHKIDF